MRDNFTTADEISNIKGLGTFYGGIAGRPKASRKKLLKGYLDAAKHREEWGNIDKKKVIKFAQKELKREQ